MEVVLFLLLPTHRITAAAAAAADATVEVGPASLKVLQEGNGRESAVARGVKISCQLSLKPSIIQEHMSLRTRLHLGKHS
jgi:hypothetical protein